MLRKPLPSRRGTRHRAHRLATPGSCTTACARRLDRLAVSRSCESRRPVPPTPASQGARAQPSAPRTLPVIRRLWVRRRAATGRTSPKPEDGGGGGRTWGGIAAHAHAPTIATARQTPEETRERSVTLDQRGQARRGGAHSACAACVRGAGMPSDWRHRHTCTPILRDDHVVCSARPGRVAGHQAGQVQRCAPIAVLNLQRHAGLDQSRHRAAMPLLARVVQQRLSVGVRPAEGLVARDELLQCRGTQVEVRGCFEEQRHVPAVLQALQEMGT
eukprot:scaffold13136_cov118-Isochrysis_galbana.AAC.2